MDDNQEILTTLKVLMIGESNVGKSRFDTNRTARHPKFPTFYKY